MLLFFYHNPLIIFLSTPNHHSFSGKLFHLICGLYIGYFFLLYCNTPLFYCPACFRTCRI